MNVTEFVTNLGCKKKVKESNLTLLGVGYSAYEGKVSTQDRYER